MSSRAFSSEAIPLKTKRLLRLRFTESRKAGQKAPRNDYNNLDLTLSRYYLCTNRVQSKYKKEFNAEFVNSQVYSRPSTILISSSVNP